MSRISIVSNAQANAEQHALFDAIQAKLGTVPNFLRVFAHSPAALQAFLGKPIDNALFPAPAD